MKEEKEIFLKHLQRSGLKRTAQRELILEVFLRTEEHVSSERLYELVGQEDATVGYTTVYRTLKILTEAGLAREVRFGDGRASQFGWQCERQARGAARSRGLLERLGAHS